MRGVLCGGISRAVVGAARRQQAVPLLSLSTKGRAHGHWSTAEELQVVHRAEYRV